MGAQGKLPLLPPSLRGLLYFLNMLNQWSSVQCHRQHWSSIAVVKYVQVPYDAAKQSFLQAGVPEWQTDGILELYKLIDSGSPATNQANLTDFEKITGEKPTNLKVWLSKVGGAFKSPFHLTICIRTHACSLITTSSFVLCLFLEKHVKLLLVMITNYNYSAWLSVILYRKWFN